jgi:hypothetical protein
VQTTGDGNLDHFPIVDREAEEIGVQRVVDGAVDWQVALERNVLACLRRGQPFEANRIRAGEARQVGLDLDTVRTSGRRERAAVKVRPEMPKPAQSSSTPPRRGEQAPCGDERDAVGLTDHADVHDLAIARLERETVRLESVSMAAFIRVAGQRRTAHANGHDVAIATMSHAGTRLRWAARREAGASACAREWPLRGTRESVSAASVFMLCF